MRETSSGIEVQFDPGQSDEARSSRLRKRDLRPDLMQLNPDAKLGHILSK
jgi:hypothetical protein